MPRTPLPAQTLIINEVSNGPSGSKEYVELLVVPTPDMDPCMPNCLDLRGWVFDDNNGYHGANGVAPGAARFSTDPLWACVPLGTLIVLYNGADPNAALPPDDLSVDDGNCVIVVSLSNLTYFEFTNTTPAPVLCDYPATGWGADPTPTWVSNVALANTGDCARIDDPNGCLVFSVCYGNTDQNTMVYFPGNGTGRVWSFNSGDPTSSANWSVGDAVGTADAQTPGAPNNAANATYITQFSNDCTPDPPSFSANALSIDGCGCEGEATASAVGSTAPYTYDWYDAAWNALGLQTSTASGLCAGTYAAIVSSSVGCTDTVSVSLQVLSSANAGEDSSLVLCAWDAPADLFSVLGGTPDMGGSWFPTLTSGSGSFDPGSDPAGIYGYVAMVPGLCPDTAYVEVTVNVAADATILAPGALCANDPPFDLITAQAGGVWSGIGIVDAAQGTFDPLLSGAGSFEVVHTIAGSCGDADTVLVQVNTTANATIVQPGPICINDTPLTMTAVVAGGTWGGMGITDPVAGTFDPVSSGSGLFAIYYDLGGPCPGSDTIWIEVVPVQTPVIGDAGPFCSNASPVDLTADILGGTWAGIGITDPATGTFNPSVPAVGSTQITYALSGSCGGTDTLDIIVLPLPVATIQVSDTIGCAPLSVSVEAVPSPPDAEQVWSMGDGNTVIGNAPFSHVYDAVGCWPIQLTVTDGNGCSNTVIAASLVCVEPSPTAAFTPSPLQPSAMDPWVTFTNESYNASSFVWTIDGGTVSDDADLVHHFVPLPDHGVLVCLIASTGPGCADTICRTILPYEEFNVHVPNAFTPNGDLVNDTFGAHFSGDTPLRFELLIFNRWGEMLYRGTEPSAFWDGRYGGMDAPEEVYVWRLIYTRPEGGERVTMAGHVTLLR